jgi:hypothetical protein
MAMRLLATKSEAGSAGREQARPSGRFDARRATLLALAVSITYAGPLLKKAEVSGFMPQPAVSGYFLPVISDRPKILKK